MRAGVERLLGGAAFSRAMENGARLEVAPPRAASRAAGSNWWLAAVAGMMAWGGIVAAVARAESEVVDGLEWFYSVEEDGCATIFHGGPTGGDFAIPERLGGCPVTSVTFIGWEDSYHNGLTSVVIPASVTNLGSHIFNACDSLTSVTIPEGVRSIGRNAFRCCYKLETIQIGAGTESIGDNSFDFCPKLTEIRLDARNPSYKIQDGALLTRDGRVLMFVPRNRSGTYVVPDGVECIKGWAFGDCNDLQRVVLPDSVRDIEYAAFWMCKGLESIDFGNGVRRIGAKSFLGCEQLASLVIPDSVEVIEGMAFDSCANLQSVSLGAGVREIGGGAFQSCHKLSSVTVPDNVESIGNSAFCYCTGLTSAVLGRGVRTIGKEAFGGTKLKTLRVPAEWEWTTILDSAKVPEKCRIVYGGGAE